MIGLELSKIKSLSQVGIWWGFITLIRSVGSKNCYPNQIQFEWYPVIDPYSPIIKSRK